jgi:hypothetical protein
MSDQATADAEREAEKLRGRIAAIEEEWRRDGLRLQAKIDRLRPIAEHVAGLAVQDGGGYVSSALIEEARDVLALNARDWH